MTMLFVLLFSCQRNHSVPMQTASPPVQLSGALLQCKKYYGSDSFGYCIASNAEHIHTISEVDQYCSIAGKWEASCRFNWSSHTVRRKRHQIDDVESYVVGCRGYSDCAFEFIDEIPSEDIFTQLNRCQKYVVADYQDCMSHALQRWSNSEPSRLEAKKLLEEYAYKPSFPYIYLAKVIHCQQLDICHGIGSRYTKCQEQTQALAASHNPCTPYGAIRKPKPTNHKR